MASDSHHAFADSRRLITMNDPFEQFERSRAGLLIPLLLFLVGAVPTAAAIRAMISIRANHPDVAEVEDPHASQPADKPDFDPSIHP